MNSSESLRYGFVISGRYLSMIERLRSSGGFCTAGSIDLNSTPPSSSLKVRLASATSAGLEKHSTTAAANALVPATAPLCAIECASTAPAAQWWKLMLGTFEG